MFSAFFLPFFFKLWTKLFIELRQLQAQLAASHARVAELEAQAAREVNWLQRLAVQQIRGVDGRQAENRYCVVCNI